jgi:hypothetical protein
LGCATSDFGIDRVPVEHLRRDQLAGELGRRVVSFRLGEMAFQDGVCGALTEIRLEHGRQGQTSAGPTAADAVSRRRHRPGR